MYLETPLILCFLQFFYKMAHFLEINCNDSGQIVPPYLSMISTNANCFCHLAV